MLRQLYLKIFLALANRAIAKYNTKIILIYGWDWSEGVRESVYNLVHVNSNARRNTDWIRWDFGLPLFVLGQPYSSSIGKFQLNYYMIRSLIQLLKPNSYKDNYLVVSLHAKTRDTLDYWLKTKGVELAILLPDKRSEQDLLVDADEFKGIVNHLVDLRGVIHKIDTASSATSSKQGKETVYLNNIQKRMLRLLEEVNSGYFKKGPAAYSRSDLIDAVVKVDWEQLFLARVSHNLSSELNGK